MPMIPRIPHDMLRDLRRIDMSEHIGGAAPRVYAEHRRFKALQRRKLIKYFDRRRVRWDQTFYLATDLGRREVARTTDPLRNNPIVGMRCAP